MLQICRKFSSGLILVGVVFYLFSNNLLSADESSFLIRGNVVNLDAKQLPVDGDAILKVRTLENQIVTVLLPARENLCKTSNVLETFFKLKVGDEVDIFGEKEGNNIVICGSEDYYLKKL